MSEKTQERGIPMEEKPGAAIETELVEPIRESGTEQREISVREQWNQLFTANNCEHTEGAVDYFAERTDAEMREVLEFVKDVVNDPKAAVWMQTKLPPDFGFQDRSLLGNSPDYFYELRSKQDHISVVPDGDFPEYLSICLKEFRMEPPRGGRRATYAFEARLPREKVERLVALKTQGRKLAVNDIIMGISAATHHSLWGESWNRDGEKIWPNRADIEKWTANAEKMSEAEALEKAKVFIADQVKRDGDEKRSDLKRNIEQKMDVEKRKAEKLTYARVVYFLESAASVLQKGNILFFRKKAVGQAVAFLAELEGILAKDAMLMREWNQDETRKECKTYLTNLEQLFSALEGNVKKIKNFLLEKVGSGNLEDVMDKAERSISEHSNYYAPRILQEYSGYYCFNLEKELSELGN